MIAIRTKKELKALAKELDTFPDWHEPDQQDVSARFNGLEFDNAMGVSEDDGFGHGSAEMVVIIDKYDIECQGPVPYAVVNLAMLFAWATE